MHIYYRNTTKHDNSIQKDKYNVLCVCKDCGRPVLNLTDISEFGSISNLKSIIAGKMREKYTTYCPSCGKPLDLANTETIFEIKD